jgi:hypothetical protein
MLVGERNRDWSGVCFCDVYGSMPPAPLRKVAASASLSNSHERDLRAGGVSVAPRDAELAFSARRAVDRDELLLVRFAVEQCTPSYRGVRGHLLALNAAEHLSIL